MALDKATTTLIDDYVRAAVDTAVVATLDEHRKTLAEISDRLTVITGYLVEQQAFVAKAMETFAAVQASPMLSMFAKRNKG